MATFLDLFLPPLTMLFVIMDPIGNMPIFMSLTESPRPGYRQLMAKRSVFIGFFVMLFLSCRFVIKCVGLILYSHFGVVVWVVLVGACCLLF